MEPEELEHEVSIALEDPESRKEREMADEVEKASELDFAKMAENMNKIAKIAKIAEVAQSATATTTEKAKDMATLDPAASTEPPVLEPDIEMEFITPEDMERLLEGGMATDVKDKDKDRKKVNPMSFK